MWPRVCASSDERHVAVQFFCDTVTEMARRHFVSGSPLRTLSLLLAGQPAEVFAASSLQLGNPMGGAVAASDQSQVTAHSYVLMCDICGHWIDIPQSLGRPALGDPKGWFTSSVVEVVVCATVMDSVTAVCCSSIPLAGSETCPFVELRTDWSWIVILG